MFAEDLSTFFDVRAGFAVSATLNGVPVSGIFDNGYDEQAIALGIVSSGPVFTLASSSVPASAINMPLVVNSITYKVVAVMTDGTGVTRLQLRT